MFIRWIAERKDAEAYVGQVRDVDSEALGEHALRSLYGKSIVANRKFRILWPAVATTMLSIAIAALGGAIEVVSRL